MGQILRARLDPVRRRQQQVRGVAGAVWGLLASGAALLTMALGRWSMGWALSPVTIATVGLIGPMLGYFVGWLWRRDWHAAARAIDSHYQLKDRATSALEFLTKPSPTAFTNWRWTTRWRICNG